MKYRYLIGSAIILVFKLSCVSCWEFKFPKVNSYNPYCYMKECCNQDWIYFNKTKLTQDLKEKVFGQPLVENVVDALTAHFNPHYSPTKALTLSFHGWTGGGKNYVSNFIAESIFENGGQSKFVHHFVGRLHFAENSKVEEYKANIQSWLEGNTTNCPQRLFIFDELDKMLPEVLNMIKPMIDYRDNINGVDYRKSIFIFLSNTGSDLINEHYLDLYKAGKRREDLSLNDFDDYIKKGAFNEKGGFFQAECIKNDLIDHYIPFLPMEERHVRLCIKSEFNLRKVSNPQSKHIEEVLKIIQWGPDNTKLFSKTGCKRIGSQVGLLVAKYYSHLFKKEL